MSIVGRTLVANRRLAGSACGKRQRARPLNSVVRCVRSDELAEPPVPSFAPHGHPLTRGKRRRRTVELAQLNIDRYSKRRFFVWAGPTKIVAGPVTS